MKGYKPVEIPGGSFNFCKTMIPALLWLSILLQSRMLVIVCFTVLVLSAILKVKRAPLVLFYTHTLNRIFPSRPVLLDENAVCFAHTVGAVFSAIAIVLLYFGNPLAGWIVTAVLALLKTSGALGFCGAMKLYGCLNNPNGTCCRAGRKIKKCREGGT